MARRKRGATGEPAGAASLHRRDDARSREKRSGSRASASVSSNRRRDAWERGYTPVAAVRWASARWHTLAWAVFGRRLRRRCHLRRRGLRAPIGRYCLCLPPGRACRDYVAATVGEMGFLRGFWMDGSRRLAWLEDYAASFTASEDTHPPATLRTGIRFDHVSFAYPGTSRIVLRGCQAGAAGRGRRGDRRRKRRRQDDDGQAAREDVRAVVGRDTGRRHAARADARRRMARTPRRGVSGFLPLRVPGAADSRRRRRAAAGRRARGRGGRRRAPARTM